MSPTACWLLTGAIVCGMGESPSPSPPAQTDAEELLLRVASVALDGPSLREFFRRQTPSAADQKRLQGLIDGLGSERFSVRQKASADLIQVGSPALFALRRRGRL